MALSQIHEVLARALDFLDAIPCTFSLPNMGQQIIKMYIQSSEHLGGWEKNEGSVEIMTHLHCNKYQSLRTTTLADL